MLLEGIEYTPGGHFLNIFRPQPSTKAMPPPLSYCFNKTYQIFSLLLFKISRDKCKQHEIVSFYIKNIKDKLSLKKAIKRQFSFSVHIFNVELPTDGHSEL